MAKRKAAARRERRVAAAAADPARTCRARVGEALADRGANAFDVLVALMDAVIDGTIDFQMRQRGLGPEWSDDDDDAGYQPDDVVCPLTRAVWNAEFEFGKGFGRRPARGTAADVAAELDSMKDSRFRAKLSPAQLALRSLMDDASNAVYRHLTDIAPLTEFPPMTPEFEPTGN